MAKKTRGLGKGLDALFPDENEETAQSQEISIDEIDPNPNQPRRSFGEDALTALTESIKSKGVLQPLLVVPVDGGRYRIVAGERRWRASRAAGLASVPCIVKDFDILEQMEIALLENLQREDLNPMETAAGMKSLMQQCGYTQEKLAEKLCMSRSNVANLLRLLSLPDEISAMITSGMLSAGHGRVLAGIENDKVKKQLAEKTAENGWSVRELEREAAKMKAAATPQVKPAKPALELAPELNDLQEKIRTSTGMKATLTGSEKKGKIVLQYYSREELEHLYEVMEMLETLQNQ